MNDEIRKILDKIQKCKDYDDKALLIEQYGATLLLDYIINLQKENQKLKEIIEHNLQSFYINSEMHKQTKDELSDYKSRVEKAVEYINKYEVCLIKNGIPEISRTHLLNILQNGSDTSVKD